MIEESYQHTYDEMLFGEDNIKFNPGFRSFFHQRLRLIICYASKAYYFRKPIFFLMVLLVMFSTTVRRFRNIHNAATYLCELYGVEKIDKLPIKYEWNSNANELHDDKYRNLAISRLFEPLLLGRGRVTMPCRSNIHFKRELILEQHDHTTTIITRYGADPIPLCNVMKERLIDYLSESVPCKLVFTPADNSLYTFMMFSIFDNNCNFDIMSVITGYGIFTSISSECSYYVTKACYTEYKIFDGQNLRALYYYNPKYPGNYLIGASVSSASIYIDLKDDKREYELLRVDQMIDPNRLMEMFFSAYGMTITPKYQATSNHDPGIPYRTYRRYIDNPGRRIVARHGRVIGYYDKDKRWFSLA